MEYIGYVVLPLMLIDLFYFVYLKFCQLLLKRYKFTEKRMREENMDIEELTIDDVKNPGVVVLYVICTICGIISVFFMKDFYVGTFFDILKNEISFIFAIFLMCFSFYLVIKRIVYGIKYAKGFLTGMNSIDFSSCRKDYKEENDEEETVDDEFDDDNIDEFK